MLAHHFTWGISEQMAQQCNRGENRIGRGEFKKQGTVVVSLNLVTDQRKSWKEFRIALKNNREVWKVSE